VASGSDPDMVDIATYNAVVPDTRLRAYFNITDNHRSFGNKGGGINRWADTLE